MKEFLIANPDIIKTLIYGISCVLLVIIYLIAVKLGIVSFFSFGKDGLKIKAAEKQFQSWNLNKLLEDQVHQLDFDTTNYALEKVDNLRRVLTRVLFEKIECTSIRRSLIESLRFPLYESCRNNNFKFELKPENIKFFVQRIMKAIKEEYEDFILEHNNSVCNMGSNLTGMKLECPRIPPLNEIYSDLENYILEDLAKPIRKKVIDICEAKIKLYRQWARSYMEMGDAVGVKVVEHYIEENKNIISALTREAI